MVYVYELNRFRERTQGMREWRETCTTTGRAPEGQFREGNIKTMAKKLKKSKKLEATKTLVTLPGVKNG
jgi:hypothetical protein